MSHDEAQKTTDMLRRIDRHSRLVMKRNKAEEHRFPGREPVILRRTRRCPSEEPEGWVEVVEQKPAKK